MCKSGLEPSCIAIANMRCMQIASRRCLLGFFGKLSCVMV